MNGEQAKQVLNDVYDLVKIKTGNDKYDEGKYDSWHALAVRLATQLQKNDEYFDKDRFLTEVLLHN